MSSFRKPLSAFFSVLAVSALGALGSHGLPNRSVLLGQM
jgi:hypothetical protein